MLRSPCRSYRVGSCCRTEIDDAGKRDRIGSDVIERLGVGKAVFAVPMSAIAAAKIRLERMSDRDAILGDRTE